MENIQPKVMCKSCEIKFVFVFYFISHKDALVAIIFTEYIEKCILIMFHKSFV